ncbi:hypothetical protein M8756_15570 [Lutimaribacter sp. EGI FJ00015]|uniref:Uncharacterized protein n=1 Tax=Lutimaribacter degradans TaxID=2945989 RepID=A0ACC5ZZ68_9RHOB|nr:hypothetical protein [Lutimaribacter sp. EGI FJ00013]MCM2563597.1 hypothetical protein [Lutimaribacter sp. EGI FJ00013]MCO0614739.1 hypothetical protein [Lutimaribacter sp. EGI FJ00015]MCO0637409.1 hypothetical protein [Lutimaribacter sp. EGI FJ00014]
MTTVYLHVGFPKCASTTVQSFFHRNDGLHRSKGVCYPKSYRDKSGYFSHRPLLNLGESDFDAAVGEIAAEAKENDCDKVFLSSEQFLKHLWESDFLASLIAALNRRFGTENVRLITLVRNQVGFVESAYAQFLRAPILRVHAKTFFRAKDTSIKGFMDHFREMNGFDFFSYADIFDMFREKIPGNPLEVYSIERDDLDGQDIIVFLSEMLGLPAPTKAEPRNERFSDQALLMLRYAMSRRGERIEPRRRRMIKRLFADMSGGFSPVLHLTGEPLERVVESSKRDDGYLKSNFSTEFGSLLEKSLAATSGRARKQKLKVGPKHRALTDYVVFADAPTLKNAERVKAELGL